MHLGIPGNYHLKSPLLLRPLPRLLRLLHLLRRSSTVVSSAILPSLDLIKSAVALVGTRRESHLSAKVTVPSPDLIGYIAIMTIIGTAAWLVVKFMQTRGGWKDAEIIMRMRYLIPIMLAMMDQKDAISTLVQTKMLDTVLFPTSMGQYAELQLPSLYHLRLNQQWEAV